MLTKNGVTIAIGQFLEAAINTAGSKEGALGLIFRALMSEDFIESKRLDQYEFKKRSGFTFVEAAEYWESQDRSNNLVAAVPTMVPGGVLGLPWWPLPPAVR